MYERGDNDRRPLYKRIPAAGHHLSADFVCPWCGGRTRYPGDKEKLTEYAADGLLDIRAEVAEIVTQYVDTAQSFWRAVALWIPATVATVAYVLYYNAPLWLVAAEMSIGSAVVFLYAYRTRVAVAPVTESDEPPESEPKTHEITRRTPFGMAMNRLRTPVYRESKRAIPELNLWLLAQTWTHEGAYTIDSMARVPGVGRKAAEGIFDAFRLSGLSSSPAEIRARTNGTVTGQSDILNIRGEEMMREIASRDRPSIILERGEAVIERNK